MCPVNYYSKLRSDARPLLRRGRRRVVEVGGARLPLAYLPRERAVGVEVNLRLVIGRYIETGRSFLWRRHHTMLILRALISTALHHSLNMGSRPTLHCSWENGSVCSHVSHFAFINFLTSVSPSIAPPTRMSVIKHFHCKGFEWCFTIQSHPLPRRVATRWLRLLCRCTRLLEHSLFPHSHSWMQRSWRISHHRCHAASHSAGEILAACDW